jgi:hypothetical protein
VTTTLRLPTIGRIGTAIAALVLALAAAPLAWAQGAANAVESINFSQIQGGKIIVKVGMRDALAATPQGFAVTNPPRIAIDLPNTVNALNRNQIEAGEGDLRSVSIVQTANRTRLVMNLTRNLTYTQALDGKQLIVTIDASQAQISGSTVATTPSAAPTCSPKRRPAERATTCATWTSAAGPAPKAAWSWTSPRRTSASTSASRAASWCSTSSTPTCRATWCAASTSAISARRCASSTRSSRAATRAW